MARHGWLVAVAAISLLTVSCKKTEKPAATSSGDKPGAAPTTKPAAKSGDDLTLLPVDSEIVLGLQWSQLAASPVWKTYVEPEMMGDKDFVAGLQQFKDRCGFDPMTTVKTVTMGMSHLDFMGDQKPDGVFILHGLDKAKTLACVDKWEADLKKEDVSVEKTGDVIVFNDKEDKVAATFISGDRLLLTIGTYATPDGIKKIAAGGSTLSTSQAFVDMYGKISKTETAWFLANGNSKIFEGASELGIRPKAVFGSANAADGVTADVRARLDSPDVANQTATNFRGQIQALAAMFDKLDLTTDGPDVKLSAAASSAKLKNLFKLLAGGGGL